MNNQSGTALLSVLMAVAILGLLILAMTQAFGNLMQVERLANLRAQKQDLRNVFRGSLACQTRCRDAVKGIPAQIGDWGIQGVCDGAGPPRLEVRRATPPLDSWAPLFTKGTEDAVCAKNIAPVPSATTKPQAKRSYCPRGQTVAAVDFAHESLTCR